MAINIIINFIISFFLLWDFIENIIKPKELIKKEKSKAQLEKYREFFNNKNITHLDFIDLLIISPVNIFTAYIPFYKRPVNPENLSSNNDKIL
ncbi:MAG: hypothetical protein GF317_05755 [Candidatus Lokiarchaeota archaeon]|nr:hypothetical protein [Candidatus Lokiarchaeota archaeon]